MAKTRLALHAVARKKPDHINQNAGTNKHNFLPVTDWILTDLNSFPRRKLDETTGTSSYYMDKNHSAGSEIQRPQYGRRSWLGSEPSTQEIDVYVQCYALLVVLARNDDDDDWPAVTYHFRVEIMNWWKWEECRSRLVLIRHDHHGHSCHDHHTVWPVTAKHWRHPTHITAGLQKKLVFLIPAWWVCWGF